MTDSERLDRLEQAIVETASHLKTMVGFGWNRRPALLAIAEDVKARAEAANSAAAR